jgi:hypothetical protein
MGRKRRRRGDKRVIEKDYFKEYEVLTVSSGGAGGSYLNDKISKFFSTNPTSNSDNLKHLYCPKSHLLNYNKINKIIFVYNDPLLSILSLFQRGWAEMQHKQICPIEKHMDYNLLKSKEAYFDYVIKYKKDGFGIINHARRWKNYSRLYSKHLDGQEITWNRPCLFLDMRDIEDCQKQVSRFLFHQMYLCNEPIELESKYAGGSVSEVPDEVVKLYKMWDEEIRPRAKVINNKIKTCIITACTGNYKSIARSIDHLDADGYIFGDALDENIDIQGNNWNRVKENYFSHEDPFVQAKYYKCSWGQIPILDKYDVVVWIDCTISIKSLPMKYLDDHDLVVYRHGARNNIHDEIDASIDARYTNYRDGLAKQRQMKNTEWLSITCFVIQKRCEKVLNMQKKWFDDVLEYSPQDQVSFPVACEHTNTKVKLLSSSGSHEDTPHYTRHKHLISYDDYYK